MRCPTLASGSWLHKRACPAVSSQTPHGLKAWLVPACRTGYGNLKSPSVSMSFTGRYMRSALGEGQVGCAAEAILQVWRRRRGWWAALGSGGWGGASIRVFWDLQDAPCGVAQRMVRCWGGHCSVLMCKLHGPSLHLSCRSRVVRCGVVLTDCTSSACKRARGRAPCLRLRYAQLWCLLRLPCARCCGLYPCKAVHAVAAHTLCGIRCRQAAGVYSTCCELRTQFLLG